MKSKNLIALIIMLTALFLIIGCGDDSEPSQKSPHGVVQLFLNHLLEDGDIKAAYELLSESDKQVLMSRPEVRAFIQGEQDSLMNEYMQVYDQLAPEILNLVDHLTRVNVRKGKAMDGYTEVGVEISYPADYQALMIYGMGIYSKLEQRLGGMQIDSLTPEQRDKIIWSLKKDLRDIAENFNVESYSTYIFPVKVVEEGTRYRIRLDLDQAPSGSFGF